MNYDSEIGIYLDPWYINGLFDTAYYFLEDDKIKFNKENPEFITDIKAKLDKLKEELLNYYKDANKPEEYSTVFKVNKVDIMAKHAAAKGVCRIYLDAILESKEKEVK